MKVLVTLVNFLLRHLLRAQIVAKEGIALKQQQSVFHVSLQNIIQMLNSIRRVLVLTAQQVIIQLNLEVQVVVHVEKESITIKIFKVLKVPVKAAQQENFHQL
jgi:hypothetical protein